MFVVGGGIGDEKVGGVSASYRHLLVLQRFSLRDGLTDSSIQGRYAPAGRKRVGRRVLGEDEACNREGRVGAEGVKGRSGVQVHGSGPIPWSS